VVTVEVAARNYLQISRSLAYRLIRNGEFPVPVLKLGRVLRVPRGPLERLVGITAAARTKRRYGNRDPGVRSKR